MDEVSPPKQIPGQGKRWSWGRVRSGPVVHSFQDGRPIPTKWVIVFAIGMFCFICVMAAGGYVMSSVTVSWLKNSEPYRLGVSQLQQSRVAADLLGPSMSAASPLGSISVSGSSGQADLNFSATGIRASGRVVLRAIKKNGAWLLTEMTLRVEGGDETVDLLKVARASMFPRALCVNPPAGWNSLSDRRGSRVGIAGHSLDRTSGPRPNIDARPPPPLTMAGLSFAVDLPERDQL